MMLSHKLAVPSAGNGALMVQMHCLCPKPSSFATDLVTKSAIQNTQRILKLSRR